MVPVLTNSAPEFSYSPAENNDEQARTDRLAPQNSEDDPISADVANPETSGCQSSGSLAQDSGELTWTEDLLSRYSKAHPISVNSAGPQKIRLFILSPSLRNVTMSEREMGV